MKKLFGILRRHIKETAVIFLLLLSGVISLVLVNVFAEVGTVVSVSVDGEPLAEYSLFVDGVYEIGEGNVLTVSSGAAYMSYADCPDGTCKRMGRISQIGEKIICLPNRVMVEIR